MTLRGVWRTSSRAGKHTEHVQSVQEGRGKDLASLLLFIYGFFFVLFFFVLFLMLYFSCCDTAWRSRKLRSEGAVCLEPGTKAIRLLPATGLVHSMGNLGVSRKKKKKKPTVPTTVTIFCASVVGRPEHGHQSRGCLRLTSDRGPEAMSSIVSPIPALRRGGR